MAQTEQSSPCETASSRKGWATTARVKAARRRAAKARQVWERMP